MNKDLASLPSGPLTEFNNFSSCQECPGFCCKRFFLVFDKPRLREVLDSADWGESFKYAARFALDHFIRVPHRDLDDLNYAYTCDMFDDRLGRCTAYNERPNTCRIYLCQEARQGTVPRKGTHLGVGIDLLWGHNTLKRRAAAIRILDTC
jgi:Fe-S-cluster containining protein